MYFYLLCILFKTGYIYKINCLILCMNVRFVIKVTFNFLLHKPWKLTPFASFKQEIYIKSNRNCWCWILNRHSSSFNTEGGKKRFVLSIIEMQFITSYVYSAKISFRNEQKRHQMYIRCCRFLASNLTNSGLWLLNSELLWNMKWC